MTLIIGILCSDGVVMASDSAATMASSGQMTISQNSAEKLIGIKNRYLFGLSGPVGASQQIHQAIKDKGSKRLSQAPNPARVSVELQRIFREAIQERINSFQLTKDIFPNEASQQVNGPALVAGYVNNKTPFLVEMTASLHAEHATKSLPFVSIGSGKTVADPFLGFLYRVFWKDRLPTLAEGRFLVNWALSMGIDMAPFGVDGAVKIMSVSIGENGHPTVNNHLSENPEHHEMIERAEEALRKAIRVSDPDDKVPSAPPMPKPPGAKEGG